MTSFDIEEVKRLLSQSKDIVITTHVSPDGDAVGSSLAMKFYLEKKGFQATVITPDEYPEFLNWLPDQDQILKYDADTERCKELVSTSDLIFCLDFNSPDRMAQLSEIIEPARQSKILIDHHQHPEQWTDVMFSDSNASSTAELVYRFIELLGDESEIDKNIGSCLYAGIVTDTGSFKFPSTSSYTLMIASKIMDLGVDTSQIQNLIYDNSSEDRLRLLGYSLTEKLNIYPEYHTAIIGLNAEDLSNHNYQTGDTEGIVNYPLSINDIRMSILISEKKGNVRLSFRSKGNVPVHEIARKYFSGGGHINAAGGASDESVKGTIEKIVSILPEFKEFLC